MILWIHEIKKGGCKLLLHLMKFFQRVIEQSLRNVVIDIDDMQFMTGKSRMTSSIKARFKKKPWQNRTLYFTFLDLEKTFGRISGNVASWALNNVGINVWMDTQCCMTVCLKKKKKKVVIVNGYIGAAW